MGHVGLGRMALSVAAVAVGAVGCSSGDDGAAPLRPPASTTTTTEAPAACSDNRHLVVFDVNGTLTSTEDEAIQWLSDRDDQPPPREDMPEIVNTYRDRGYEIMYVTSIAEDFVHGGVPILESMMEMLDTNGFPTEGTTLSTSSAGHPGAELGAELVDLAAQGVSVDAAYTDNVDDIEAFNVGGATDVYLLGTEAATTTATVLGDDLGAQLEAVEALPRVCT